MILLHVIPTSESHQVQAGGSSDILSNCAVLLGGFFFFCCIENAVEFGYSSFF
jgi:hypothetical protein